MGRIQEARQEGRDRVQIAMSKAALAPVIQQLLDLQVTLNQIPEKIERGEEGRAERLRQTIQPTAKALIEGMQILHSEISTFRAAAERQEAASRELQAEVAALREETASQREAMTVLQEDLSAFRETSTPGALGDLMVHLRADLTESRERVGELLAASADLLTDLRESGPQRPTFPGEKKWNGPGRPNSESGISPLAVAWRILAMRLGSDPPSLQVLNGCQQQAVDMHPIGTGEDLVLATAWQLLEQKSRHGDPKWGGQMEKVKATARLVLGFP